MTNARPKINNEFGRIELTAYPKLGCSIIVGIFVVPIVPSLSNGKEGHIRILRWIADGIIRVITI